MLRHLLLYCTLAVFAAASKPLSILLVQPLASTSHHIWTMSLVEKLLHRGHHVHLVSIHEAHVKDELAQNLTAFVFDDLMTKLFQSSDYNPNAWKKLSVYEMIDFQYVWGYDTCFKVIKTKAAKDLLETVRNVKFDVIVQDITLTECMLGLWEVAKGKPPIVAFMPLGSAPWLKDYLVNPSYPTIRPYAYMRTDTLWQRTTNLIFYTLDDYKRHYYYLPLLQQLTEEYLGHKIRPLYEIGKEASMVLVNTHTAFEAGIPLPPNAVEIGGLHAQDARPIADENIRKFLDGAIDGAVVISLGTNVAWKSIGMDKLEAVLNAASKLKQRVLWKLKIDVPFPIPDNVMIMKWLPQNDVLTHENVKAVWTHAGLLSTHEAIWHGVPVIGMPFFLDQGPNIDMLVDKGAGIRLDSDLLTTQYVSDTFDKILNDKSYMKNMKQLSSEFRDRAVSPLDLAAWSIEHAARHRPKSMVSPIVYQSWVERNMVDVYLFLFFSFILIMSVLVFILKKLFNFYYHHIYLTYKLRNNKKDI